jgi:hypothetical protein
LATSVPDPPEQSLSDLIAQILSRTKEADPHVIARRYLAKLTPEMREQLVLVGFADRISRMVATVRSDGVKTPTRSVGKSKWQVAQRVCPAGEHKLLSDCDLSDLLLLEKQHLALSAMNQARALEYRDLADQLFASGCDTVGEMWRVLGMAA